VIGGRLTKQYLIGGEAVARWGDDEGAELRRVAVFSGDGTVAVAGDGWRRLLQHGMR
jgi:hypothetical protein